MTERQKNLRVPDLAWATQLPPATHNQPTTAFSDPPGGFMAGTDVLLTGFFGTSDRGFLGWSGLYLVTTPSGRRPAANCRGDEESVFGTRSEGQTTDRIGMILIDLQRMLSFEKWPFHL